MKTLKERVLRQSNIELLRVFCMLGVIVLHINNNLYGGGLEYSASRPLNHIILVILQDLFCCSVDLMVLISGYFLSQQNQRNMMKPIKLIVQIILFGELMYFASCFIKGEKLTIGATLFQLIPASYFPILYVALYIMSPLINNSLHNMKSRGLDKAVGVLLILFSVEPWVADILVNVTGNDLPGLSFVGMYGSGEGYTIVNFALCYIVGLWLQKRKDVTCKMKSIFLIGVLVLDIAFGVMCRITWDVIPVEYCSPFVISQAAIIFILFDRIKIYSRFINLAAKASFTVYLVNILIISNIADEIHRMAVRNTFIMIIELCGITLSIYFIAWLIDYIYNLIMNVMIYRHICSEKLKFEFLQENSSL